MRLRGAAAGETLVLIDGVRIGDPTDTDGSSISATSSAADIERIEVLRGPQSALYGSDAMGGVINIITRKGSKTPQRTVTVEGGSYGTLSTRATMSGGDDHWTYSLGVNLLHSDGFPALRLPRSTVRSVDRQRRHAAAAAARRRSDNKGGATARFSYQASPTASPSTSASRCSATRCASTIPSPSSASDVFSNYNHVARR